jgi:hypothetical protein
MIWGNLLHLSQNMWCDRDVSDWGPLKGEDLQWVSAKPVLRFDEKLWNDLIAEMTKAKMNMVVIDLGDGVQYASHPEIAVKDAWTPAKLKEELKKLRDAGLEPIPKLNFSTAHDTWLGPYARCISTPMYYKVCDELIAEVVELFAQPRFFHLGYDEETFNHQKKYLYVVVRQYELWWHDFEFFRKQVERHGVRPWIWADYVWEHSEDFYRQMSKSVLMSNWYYGMGFDVEKEKAPKAYVELDAHGYDQIPTASNWSTKENFTATVSFCRKHIAAERLLGFLQTPWKPTVERFRADHLEAIRVVGEAIAAWGKG